MSFVFSAFPVGLSEFTLGSLTYSYGWMKSVGGGSGGGGGG